MRSESAAVPSLGAQDLIAPTSYSSYNALQVGLTHRASANLVYQFSYTWSHCIDNSYAYAGLGGNNVSSSITNPYDWNADRGNCGYDIRNNISANAVYMFPFKGNRWKEGWQLSGITSWRSGIPFSVGEGDQMDTGNIFDSERPNYSPNAPGAMAMSMRTSPRRIGSTKPALRPRSMGRSAIWEGTCCWGPGYAETDISVTKITRINERMTLQLRGKA